MILRWWRAGSVVALIVLTGGGSAHAEELVVSAAASLTTVLSEIKPRFEAAHPGDRIHLNFAASGALARQIEGGAPADIFISASPQPMDQLQSRHLIEPDSRMNLLVNELVLVVPRSERRPGMQGFDDLPRVSRLAMGDPGYVPAGQYARQVLMNLQLWTVLQPKLIYGQDVRQVLEYVARGEVDAGIVFATDAASLPGQVVWVANAPRGSHDPVVYPAAMVAGSGHGALARAFLRWLASPESRKLFEQHGFGWALK